MIRDCGCSDRDADETHVESYDPGDYGHGERSDYGPEEDRDAPPYVNEDGDAYCFCGHPNYLTCDAWLFGSRWVRNSAAVALARAFEKELEVLDDDEDGYRRGVRLVRTLQDSGYLVIENADEHVIQLNDRGWALQHSVWCRVQGDMLRCPWTVAAQDHDWDSDGVSAGHWAVDVHWDIDVANYVLDIGEPR